MPKYHDPSAILMQLIFSHTDSMIQSVAFKTVTAYNYMHVTVGSNYSYSLLGSCVYQLEGCYALLFRNRVRFIWLDQLPRRKAMFG